MRQDIAAASHTRYIVHTTCSTSAWVANRKPKKRYREERIVWLSKQSFVSIKGVKSFTCSVHSTPYFSTLCDCHPPFPLWPIQHPPPLHPARPRSPLPQPYRDRHWQQDLGTHLHRGRQVMKFPQVPQVPAAARAHRCVITWIQACLLTSDFFSLGFLVAVLRFFLGVSSSSLSANAAAPPAFSYASFSFS